MDLGLAGRVYALTGASRGLGYATAQCLVADGASVVISARDPQRVASAVASLQCPDRVAGLPADLGDNNTPDRLVAAATDRFGRLDGVLISVGGPPPGTALDVTDSQWRAAFDTIFLGAIRTARVFSDHLTAGGVIGFVLSSSARAPIPGLGISNGLRPGILGAAKDMAETLGPRGIRVVCFLPGRIATDRSEELLAATADPKAAKAAIEASIPLRRIGSPEEFGRVVAFALSPAASFLTGVALPIDGGADRRL